MASPPRTHFSMIRNFHLADLFTIANGFCGVDHSVVDRQKLVAICVLLVDELIGRGDDEVRIAELFHYEKRLRVPFHTVPCEPGAKAALVPEALTREPAVPYLQALAGLLFKDADPHLPVSLPITNGGHFNPPSG